MRGRSVVMVLFTTSHGNTFVGGTCALPSVLLVWYNFHQTVCSCISMSPLVWFANFNTNFRCHLLQQLLSPSMVYRHWTNMAQVPLYSRCDSQWNCNIKNKTLFMPFTVLWSWHTIARVQPVHTINVWNSWAVSPPVGGLHGTVVERQSLTGEVSLFCARPTADGWPLVWVNRPL